MKVLADEVRKGEGGGEGGAMTRIELPVLYRGFLPDIMKPVPPEPCRESHEWFRSNTEYNYSLFSVKYDKSHPFCEL